MNYHTIVHVHVSAEFSRDNVIEALENELGAGHYLFRAEPGPGDFSVTGEVVADNPELAQSQADHVVSEALIRAGVEAGTQVVEAEIGSGS